MMSGAATEEPALQRPIPDHSTWTLLREVFLRVKEKSDDPRDLDLVKTITTAVAANDNGFRVPIEIRRSAGKGRGVFATGAIPKGTTVMSDTPTGYFFNEREWRAFLSQLPRDLACDVVIWAWVADYNENDDGTRAVGLDLGEGSLMNHGSAKTRHDGSVVDAGDGSADNNLIYNTDSWDLLAARDILPGEELLCDYCDFHDYEHELHWYTESCKEYTFSAETK